MLTGGCPWQFVHDWLARQDPAVSVCVWQELHCVSGRLVRALCACRWS